MNGKSANFNLKNEAFYSKIAPLRLKNSSGAAGGPIFRFFWVIFMMKSGRIAYL